MEQEENKYSEISKFGQHLIGWEVDEYRRHDRPFRWYITITVIGVALILYALLTANFLFAIIILLFGVISFLAGLREPERVDVHITNNGAVLGQSFYPYKEIKDFSIVYEPPEVKVL